MRCYKRIATLPREILMEGNVYVFMTMMRMKCLFTFDGEQAAFLWLYQMHHDSPTRSTVVATLQRANEYKAIAKFERAGRRIVEAKLEATATKLEATATQLEVTETKLEATETKLEATATKLEAAKARVRELEEMMSRMGLFPHKALREDPL
jgi:hypothetical protein